MMGTDGPYSLIRPVACPPRKMQKLSIHQPPRSNPSAPHELWWATTSHSQGFW